MYLNIDVDKMRAKMLVACQKKKSRTALANEVFACLFPYAQQLWVIHSIEVKCSLLA